MYSVYSVPCIGEILCRVQTACSPTFRQRDCCCRTLDTIVLLDHPVYLSLFWTRCTGANIVEMC